MVVYRLLGSLEARSDGYTANLGAPKERGVLAILLLHAGQVVPSDRLIEMLWGEQAPRTAAHSIQLYVSELRKALAPMAGDHEIVTTGAGYSLTADPDTIDALRFERLVSEGTRRVEAGDRAGGMESLREALRLWRGPPLPEFAYEEFAQEAINRLEKLRLDALEELAGAELAEGHEQAALALAEDAIEGDPLRERAREMEMVALYRAGRHPEALRSYRRFQAVLAEELGLDPSPRLQRLQERILRHDSGLERQAAAAPSPPRAPIRTPGVARRVPPRAPATFPRLRRALVSAGLVLAGFGLGFVGGLLSPGGISPGGVEPVEIEASAAGPALPRLASRYGPEADCGIRHLTTLGAAAPLTDCDDYATRHPRSLVTSVEGM